MAMLFALLVGFLIVQFDVFHFPLPTFEWVKGWIKIIKTGAPLLLQRGYGLILTVAIVPALSAFFIALLLQGPLSGALELFYLILLVVYCLGPLLLEGVRADDASSVLNSLFESIFVPVFYGLCFGVFGLVFAAMIRFMENNPELDDDTHFLLNHIEKWINWVPVRIYALLITLAGSFAAAFSTWQQYLYQGHAPHTEILEQSALKSLAVEDLDVELVLGLIKRAHLIFAVILAIMLMAKVIF